MITEKQKVKILSLQKAESLEINSIGKRPMRFVINSVGQRPTA